MRAAPGVRSRCSATTSVNSRAPASSSVPSSPSSPARMPSGSTSATVAAGGVHGGIDITPGHRGQDGRGQVRRGPDARVGVLTPDARQYRQQVRRRTGRSGSSRAAASRREAEMELSPGVPDSTAGLDETVGDAGRTGGVAGDSLNVRRRSRFGRSGQLGEQGFRRGGPGRCLGAPLPRPGDLTVGVAAGGRAGEDRIVRRADGRDGEAQIRDRTDLGTFVEFDERVRPARSPGPRRRAAA